MEDLLWRSTGDSLNMLIPKKRGKGYLKVPIGHYRNELCAFLEDLCPEEHTITGLDGYVRVPITQYSKAKEVALKTADFLGVNNQEISSHRFYKILIPKQINYAPPKQ